MILATLGLSFDTPEEHLACEEAMLDFAENSSAPGFLRFFESRQHFVVLGYAKKLDEEVFEEVCQERRIPILRRCSGGGTVLQGPGCFNYSLVLAIDSRPGLDTITGANRLIMQANRECLARLLGAPVAVEGVSDLTIGGVKFSGNAQRRRKRCLLFHGSFLLGFNLPLIAQVLRLPAQQPEYRKNRDHGAFLANIGLDPGRLADGLRAAWNARETAPFEVEAEIRAMTAALARTKYSTDSWNRRPLNP